MIDINPNELNKYFKELLVKLYDEIAAISTVKKVKTANIRCIGFILVLNIPTPIVAIPCIISKTEINLLFRFEYSKYPPNTIVAPPIIMAALKTIDETIEVLTGSIL